MSELIGRGERSTRVADVQTRLRELGLSIDDDAGHFGESTTHAVRAFQQQRHILVDGIVGPHTWAELVEAGYKLGDRALYLMHPLLRGDDVLALQARLNALGFDAGREDGIFGPDTDRAVRSFQREYGVSEDGIFGRITHAALIGLRVNRPMTAAELREELKHAERQGIRDAVLVVDPGHGGNDKGRLGPHGTSEADICWDVAGRLADRLAGAGAIVRFTRTEIDAMDTERRATVANDIAADLFLSLHLNAADGSNASGAAAYYFPRSKSGAFLAECIQNELISLGLGDCRTHARSYPILRETRMPAVLVEPCYITNPEDENRLLAVPFRGQLADAIARGVLRYFRLPHHTSVA